MEELPYVPKIRYVCKAPQPWLPNAGSEVPTHEGAPTQLRPTQKFCKLPQEEVFPEEFSHTAVFLVSGLTHNKLTRSFAGDNSGTLQSRPIHDLVNENK